MSRRRGGWDEDFYGGQRPRRHDEAPEFRPRDDRPEFRPQRDEGPEFRPIRDEGPEFRPPRGGYEYDERERGRGGRRFGLRGDYDDTVFGRGDYYRDDYYTGRRPDERDFDDEQTYERGRRRSRARRSHLRCRDIMTRDVTVASRATTLEEVARMMRDEDTGVIPVVEPGETDSDSVTEVQRVPVSTAANGKLVGLITDRDIVVRAVAEGRDAREVLAEEVMTTDLHAVRPNDRVIEAIRKMGDKQVRRLPVVDREGNLRGIISMADIALETEADRELADALEEISSGSSFWNRIFG
jgi:CBS domain-containing protein